MSISAELQVLVFGCRFVKICADNLLECRHDVKVTVILSPSLKELVLGAKVTSESSLQCRLQTSRLPPAVVSPVGGAGLDPAPALPLREDPRRGPGTSKRIELPVLPLLSLDLQPGRTLGGLSRTAVWIRQRQPVVVPEVVVPEGPVPSLVLNAELHPVGRVQELRHRQGEGEGVGVGAAVHVVQVAAGNVLEGAPRVEGDPH